MILYEFLNSDGVGKIINLMNLIIKAIRWVVPIGLIVMTSIDVFNKVINPDDKEGQKKIMTRIVGAIIVFFLPTIINLIIKLVDIGGGNTSYNNKTSQMDTKRQEIIDTVTLLNCPSDDKVFDKGDKFTLNAKGTGINWVMNVAQEYLNITPSSNGKSANIEVMDYYAAGNVTVIARGKGSYEMCKINIRNKERTEGSVLINNCPKDKIKIGDTFILNTVEDVNWYNDIYSKYYEIVSSTSKSATIKIIGHYNNYLPINIRVKNSNNQNGYCSFYTHQ